MTRYSKELIREEIRDYSDWTEEELSSDEENLQRLVWLLAWDVSGVIGAAIETPILSITPDEVSTTAGADA